MRMKALGYMSAFCLFVFFPGSASACGWWGDGEMSQKDDAVIDDLSGEPDAGPIPAGVLATRLPGNAGYGIAVFRPDMAVPYLRATNGRKFTKIGQLKEVGFIAVVDLGTPATTTRLHRTETETLGMRYVSIPAIGGMPTVEQVELFSKTIGDSANRPLVIYAPESSLLGNMWVLHRLAQGAPRGTALGEGLAFGTSRELEEYLAGR